MSEPAHQSKGGDTAQRHAILVQRLGLEHEASLAKRAREDYIAACSQMPTLGKKIELRAEGLYVVGPIAAHTPITAFPPDVTQVSNALRLNEVAIIHSPDGGSGPESISNLYGPLAATADPEMLAELLLLKGVPVNGFPPLSHVAGDPLQKISYKPNGTQCEIRLDMAAHQVAGIIEDNPYAGISHADEALDTLAQITIDYMRMMLHKSNVRIVASPGQPTVLLALRDLVPGELLQTGVTPCHLLNDDAVARKIVPVVAKQMAQCGCPSNNVAEIMGL